MKDRTRRWIAGVAWSCAAVGVVATATMPVEANTLEPAGVWRCHPEGVLTYRNLRTDPIFGPVVKFDGPGTTWDLTYGAQFPLDMVNYGVPPELNPPVGTTFTVTWPKALVKVSSKTVLLGEYCAPRRSNTPR